MKRKRPVSDSWPQKRECMEMCIEESVQQRRKRPHEYIMEGPNKRVCASGQLERKRPHEYVMTGPNKRVCASGRREKTVQVPESLVLGLWEERQRHLRVIEELQATIKHLSYRFGLVPKEHVMNGESRVVMVA